MSEQWSTSEELPRIDVGPRRRSPRSGAPPEARCPQITFIAAAILILLLLMATQL